MTIARLGIDIDSTDAIAGAANIEKLVPAAKRAEKAVDSLAVSTAADFKRIKAEADKLAIAMAKADRQRQAGIQNLGFQLQDFAVQVGAGTAASVALGQQLPQLLSGFGTLGVVAGTAAAVTIPLGAALFSMGDRAGAAGDALETLATASDRARAALALQAGPVEDLIAAYGRADEGIRTLVASIAQLETDRAVSAARALRSEFEGFTDTTRILPGISEGALSLARDFSLAQSEAEALQAAMIAFEGADTLAAMADAARSVADAIAATRDENGELSAEMLTLNERVLGIADELERARGATSGAASAAGDLAGATGAALGEAVALADTWLAISAAAREASQQAALTRALGDAVGATSSDAARRGVMNASPLLAPVTSGIGNPNFRAPRASSGGGGGSAGRALIESERAIAREREALAREVDRAIREIEDERLRRIEEVNRFTADSFSDMFSDAITGASSLKESIGDLVAELGRMAAAQGFRTLLDGFGGTAVGGFLSSAFGIGARATGGPVTSGRPYMVGERGPELFVPNQSGGIVPNHKLGGGAGNVTVNVSIDATGADAAGLARVQNEVRGLKAALPEIILRTQRDARLRYSV